MAFDGSFLYVADGGSQTIRRIDPATGEVMTLAGSAGQAGSTDGTGSNARFNGPTGVACGSSFLYVADNGNATIRRIDLATREVTTLAGSVGQFGSEDGIGSAARFSGALGIASDGSFLYIAEGGSGAIRKIDIATREVTTLAGSVGQIGSEDGTGSAARFNAPTGIASDGSFLYVADRNNHAIRQIR
jgi:DNA-binding beta-propeller fold protein YncE